MCVYDNIRLILAILFAHAIVIKPYLINVKFTRMHLYNIVLRQQQNVDTNKFFSLKSNNNKQAFI